MATVLAFPASSWKPKRYESPVVALPVPLMSATLSFDRTAFTDAAVTIDFGVEASLDGATWPLLLIGGRTNGGTILDRAGNPKTVHSVSRAPNTDAAGNPVALLPAGARVRAYMVVAGGTAVLGAGTLETT